MAQGLEVFTAADTGERMVTSASKLDTLHRTDGRDWVRRARDHCLAAKVACFHKQWGGRTAKAGGREVDGRTWDQMLMMESKRESQGKLDLLH
jgi:protein gp37